MSESKFTPEFIKAQRALLEESKTTRAVAPLVQFRATAVENYPPALDEIERLQAESARLTVALDAANADAEALAKTSNYYSLVTGKTTCVHCGENDHYHDIEHAPDCPIALHRVRVGGGK